MSRRYILNLAVLLLLLAAVFLSVSALQASSVTVTVASVEASSGGTVDVPVRAAGASGIGAMQMDLVFDAAVLKPDSVNKGALLGNNALLQSNIDVAGRVIIALVTLDGIKGDGDILNVRFKVIGQSGQSSVLKLEKAMAWEGASHQDVLVKTEAGQFKMTGGANYLLWILIAIIVLLLLIILLILWRRSRSKKTAPSQN
jgi:hypothetical protein